MTTNIKPGDTVRTKGHWLYKDGTEFTVTKVFEPNSTATLGPGYVLGDPQGYGVWTNLLEEVEPSSAPKYASGGFVYGDNGTKIPIWPSARSGCQEYANGTITARGETQRDRHIRHINDLDAVIRRRNETIERQKAQLAEYAAQLEKRPAGSNEIYDPNVVTPSEQHALRALQKRIGEANAAKGFHRINHFEPGPDDAAIADYATARLALITTEVAEAIEELRHGRAVDETYYAEGEKYTTTRDTASVAAAQTITQNKPEGVPSELADAVIRAFDFAHEFAIDLAAMIDEKLRFNATRPRRHGKKF